MFRTRFLATIVALGVASVSPASILVTDWSGNLNAYNPSNNTYGSINNTLAQPTGMTIGPDGMLYMSNLATNTIDKYNPSTGAFISNVVLLGSGFQPTGIKFGPGPNPDLFISSQVAYPFAPANSGGVYRYNLTSHVLSSVVTGITQAEGLLFAGGNLYIAQLNNYTGNILKYDFVNPASVFIANGQGGLGAATGMAIGPDGAMYVADVTGQAIRKYDLNDPNINSTFIGSGLYSPTDLAFDDGHLYVANIGSGGGPDGYLSQFNAANGAFQNIAVPNLFYGSAVVAVPEPTSLMLLGCGSIGWWVKRRRRSL